MAKLGFETTSLTLNLMLLQSLLEAEYISLEAKEPAIAISKEELFIPKMSTLTVW